VPQRFVCHHRIQIGAADANIDDVADRSSGVAAPATATDVFEEDGHAIPVMVGPP